MPDRAVAQPGQRGVGEPDAALGTDLLRDLSRRLGKLVVVGLLADRIGRLRVLGISIALYAIGALASGLAQNIHEFAAAGFVAGFGLGAEWFIGATGVAEAFPEKERPKWTGRFHSAWYAGFILAAAIVPFIVGPIGWRGVYFIGIIPRSGGYAEQVVVDERMLFALPDAVDDRAGTLVEPLAVAVRAAAKVVVATSEPVLVIGAGPIGRLTGLVLRERGYERAVVLSRNPGRPAIAGRLGLTTIRLDELRIAEAPACVFDCGGTPSSAQLGVELLRPLGQLMLVGLSLAPAGPARGRSSSRSSISAASSPTGAASSSRRSICWPP